MKLLGFVATAILACVLAVALLQEPAPPATPWERPPAPSPRGEPGGLKALDDAVMEPEAGGAWGDGSPAFVSGRVMGKYGTILCVPVRVLVDGKETDANRTDTEGRYSVEAPAGIAFDLEAKPESWTKLQPMRRRLTLAPGADVTEDFVFGAGAGASGHMQGPVEEECVTLFAIRVEDYPLSAGGWSLVGDLRHAPKVIAEACGTFTFAGLDLSATYRIAVDGYDWGLTRPVLTKAGDTGVGVPVERLLYFVVEAKDIEGSNALARFSATVVDRAGRAHERLEGREGRLVYRARHPEQIPPDPPHLDGEELLRRLQRLQVELLAAGRPAPSLTGDPARPWTLVVGAEGYIPVTGTPSGMQRFFLQRARQPNVLLCVADDDGAPFDGELEGAFEAAEQPDGKAELRVAKVGPGRFRAVFPPGAWRLRLWRAGDEVASSVYVDVDAPSGGTVTVDAPRLPSERP